MNYSDKNGRTKEVENLRGTTRYKFRLNKIVEITDSYDRNFGKLGIVGGRFIAPNPNDDYYILYMIDSTDYIAHVNESYLKLVS